MERKSNQFFLELFLTFLLLFSVTFLFGEILSGYRVYLILGSICGICFSWGTRNKENQAALFVINVGVLGSLSWVIYSILNSSFIYREAMFIWVKGILVLETLFAFNIYRHSFLTYIQLLTIPLFMAQAIFVKYNNSSIGLAFGYIITGLIILKLKFYDSLGLYSKKNDRKNYSVFLSVAFFFIIVISSWVFFYKFPLRIEGFFQEACPYGEENEFNKQFSRNEYYDLQDEIQEEITKLIPEFNSPQAKYEVLGLLSLLIKEAPCAMEAEKGELGLISYLKQPGPGLEKKDTEESPTIPKQPRPGSEKKREELAAAIKNYMDQKIALNLNRNKDSIMEIFKKNPFNIKERISFLIHVNKIQQSNSYENISKIEQEAMRNIDNSSLGSNVKMALKEHMRQFKEWKTFDLYRKALANLGKNTNSPEEIHDARDSRNLLENQREFKERVAGEETDVSPELKELLEAKTHQLEITFLIQWLIKKLFKIAVFLIIIIAIMFFILYALTEYKKVKLVSLSKNPREFTISLYENIKGVLTIFGPKYKDTMLPLVYAGLVERMYLLKNNLFVRWTEKFEEAKYSSHILGAEDANLVTAYYNSFLRVLFSRQNKFPLVFKYCLTLIYRRPLFITECKANIILKK